MKRLLICVFLLYFLCLIPVCFRVLFYRIAPPLAIAILRREKFFVKNPPPHLQETAGYDKIFVFIC